MTVVATEVLEPAGNALPEGQSPATPVPAMPPGLGSATPAAAISVRADLQRAEEFAQINESLHHRESLLAASAKASRLLLEAPDVMEAVPDVLRMLGEAADADRV